MRILSVGSTTFYKTLARIVRKSILIIAGASFFGLAFIPPQKREARDETEVKAVFLFNFAHFVEWPPEAFGADSSLVIGILGKDPFGAYLDETVRDEVVNGYPLKVERYASVQQVKQCHILFIKASRSIRVEHVLRKLKGKQILTVSDAANFARQGGMIRLMNDDNKIKLQINLSAVKDSNISISSKLLGLSEIIE
jgi:hypothetical protein